MWGAVSRQKNKICFDSVEADRALLKRVRSSDPDLRELTLHIPQSSIGYTGLAPFHLAVCQAFRAVVTNTTLETLTIICDNPNLFAKDIREYAQSALHRNKSLKDIRIDAGRSPNHVADLLDVAMSSPNLEALTISSQYRFRPGSNVFRQIVLLLQANTKVRFLTIEGFAMDPESAELLAEVFHENHIIKNLRMRRAFFWGTSAVSFIQALPPGHSLEAISLNENHIDDDSGVTIIQTLCDSPVRDMSLAGNMLTAAGCERIVDVLRTNDHGFTKLKLFYDDSYNVPWESQIRLNFPWHNKIRLEIDMLTWGNQLQVEKHSWVDRFLDQDNNHSPSATTFLFALERANQVDNERFSKAPNMLFYLIKEMPDWIAAQATRHVR